MANLQKLDSLFGELRKNAETLDTEVTNLDKRKTDLSQECMTLEAKKRHIEGLITDTTNRHNTIEHEHNTLINNLQLEIEQLKTSRSEAETTLVKLKQERQSVLSDLQTMRRAYETEKITLDGQIMAKKAALSELEATKQTLQTESDKLEVIVKELLQTIADLDRQLAAKQSETDEKVNSLSRQQEEAWQKLVSAKHQLDDKQDEYEELEKKVTAIRKEADDTKKQRQEFLTYEKQARIALKTREDALLEREQQAELHMATSRRRSGVLDKL